MDKVYLRIMKHKIGRNVRMTLALNRSLHSEFVTSIIFKYRA